MGVSQVAARRAGGGMLTVPRDANDAALEGLAVAVVGGDDVLVARIRAAFAVRSAPDGATTASPWGSRSKARRTASSPSGAELRFSGSRVDGSVTTGERGAAAVLRVRGECSSALAAARRQVRKPPAQRSSAKPHHLDVTSASTVRTAPARQWTALPSPWRVSRSAIGRGRRG